MEKLHVVIVDSGVNLDHVAFANNIYDVEQYDIEKSEKCYEMKLCEAEIGKRELDSVGHGTGVFFLVSRYIPEAKYTIIRALKEGSVDEEVLLEVLNIIDEQIECNMIMISAGLEMCEGITALKDVCDRLVDKGVTIVAAFSNEGGLTYPAAFEKVIGVDYSLSCFRINEYQVVFDSEIDFRGIGLPQRVPSTKNEYCKQAGASFALPHIAGKIGQLLANGYYNKKEIKKIFMEDASKVFYGNPKECKNLEGISINRAIVFPYGKEILPLLMYNSQLDFEILDILDTKKSENCYRDVAKISGLELSKKYIIKALETYDIPDNADAFIIGHFSMYEKRVKAEIKTNILNMVKNGRFQTIYMFDELEISLQELKQVNPNIFCYVPRITEEDVPINRMGKLHVMSSPVLGIFGTGPKQGKYTLQISLRQYLSKLGYRVANLGTEPTSPLFGFEGTYPMGKNSGVSISGPNSILAINNLIKHIDMCEPDIILVGSQSQSIPTGMGNIRSFNHTQYELILGTQPDAYFLCVSYSDDISYIRRTINFLESINIAKVLALVLFPMDYENLNGNLVGKGRQIPETFLKNRKKELESKLEREVVILGEKGSLEKLV